VAPTPIRDAHGATATLAATAMLAAGLLAGCATPAPPVAGPIYSGRIAVRSDAAPAREARSVTGQFELRGTPAHGQLVLTSPIGTTVARARWKAADERVAAAAGVADIDLEANGRTTHYDNFDDMTEAALGDSLPLAAMFDWLSGRPWPHSPASFDAGHTSFEQLGWHVDRSRFESDQLIAADRPLPPPALHVRVKLDQAPGEAPPPSAPASTPALDTPAPAAR
jgi:outer membrane lipoprotein LolB